MFQSVFCLWSPRSKRSHNVGLVVLRHCQQTCHEQVSPALATASASGDEVADGTLEDSLED